MTVGLLLCDDWSTVVGQLVYCCVTIATQVRQPIAVYKVGALHNISPKVSFLTLRKIKE